MKTYAHYGFKDFILCLGYKGDFIKDYFRNYHWNTCDITLMLGRTPAVQFHDRHDEENWSVTLADTGEESMTAFRVKRIQRYIPEGEPFLLTYGDGLSTIDINASIVAHKASGKVCTISSGPSGGKIRCPANRRRRRNPHFQRKTSIRGCLRERRIHGVRAQYLQLPAR